MLFETSKIKPGNVAARPPARPVAPVRPAASAATRNSPVLAKLSTVVLPKTYAQKAAQKIGFRNDTTPPKFRSSGVTAKVGTTLQKNVKGWPTARLGTRQTVLAAANRALRPVSYVKRPGTVAWQQPAGIRSYSRTPGLRTGNTVSSSSPGIRQTYGTPYPGSTSGWGVYRRGTIPSQRFYTTNYTNPGLSPVNIPSPVSPGYYPRPTVPVPPPISQPWGPPPLKRPSYPNRRPQPSAPPAAKPLDCSLCGCASGNCDTLSGFALGSSMVLPVHQKQVTVLAQRIITQKIGFVISTGHTDASGTNDNNLILGHNRAVAVVKAIRTRMHEISPFSQENVFWKMMSRGSSQIISANSALNRRVEVCLR